MQKLNTKSIYHLLDTVDVDAVNDVVVGSRELSETFLVVICVVDGSIAVDVSDVNDPSCD